MLLLTEILPNPECPDIGPECPDYTVRSIRTLIRSVQILRPGVSELIPGVSGYLFANGYFLRVEYIYSPYPLNHTLSCHFVELNSTLAKKQALSLPLLHSRVIPLRDSSESVTRARIRASEPHFHLLSTWFWSSPRIQVCYSWNLVLLDG